MADQGVNVANLVATLKLDLSQFQGAVQQLDQNLGKIQTGMGTAGTATDTLQAAATKAGAALSEMGGAGSLLSSSLTLLLTPVALAVAAFAGLEHVMTQAKEAAIANAREVQTLMAVSGLSATQADDLSDTFKALGFSGDMVTMAMFRMSAEIESGGAGLGRLGVTLRDTAGGLKSEGELFLEVRNRISELGSASERNALLIDVFGRAGRSLAPIFALSREEFDKWMQHAGLLSPWSNEAQAATMELVRAQAALSLAWNGLWESLGAALAGPAAGFLLWLADVIVKTKEAVQWAHNHADALAEVPLLGLAGPGPTPSALGAGDQTQPATGLPTLADFQASKAVLASIFAEQQQHFAKMQALRQADVAADKIDQSVALQSTFAYLNARESATTTYFANLRALTIKQYAEDNAAAIIHLAEVKTQESAVQAAIVQARIAAQAQLAALTVAQQKQQLAQNIAGWVAMAEETITGTEAVQKADAAYLDSIKHLWEEMRQAGIQVWVDIAAAQKTNAEEGTKVWQQQFGELTKDMEAFNRQVTATKTVGGIQQGAGVGVNITDQLQTLTQSRIASLVQQSQPWRDAIKNVEEGSEAFIDLQGHIAEADRQLGILTGDLTGLQNLNQLKATVSDVFGALNRAVSTSITGIIQGTTTASKAFENMGQSILLSIQEIIIKRAFAAMEKAFDEMLDRMMESAIKSGLWNTIIGALGGIDIGGGGGASATSTGTSPAGADILRGASGGIVTQPTLALIGEGGPEALVPLERGPGAFPLPLGGSDSGGLTVIVNNYTNSDVESKQSVSADGKRQLEVLIQESTRKGIAAGSFDRVFQSTYGLNRQGTRR